MMIYLPEVVNIAPPEVAKGIEDVSWLSAPRTSAVISACFAMTLISFFTTPPLALLSTSESTEERLTLDKQYATYLPTSR